MSAFRSLAPILPTCALCSCLVSSPALAVVYESESAIKAVQASQRGAIVTRSGTVSVAPGEHTLVISGLPAALDLSRLQLTLDDPTARLGSIKGRREYQDQLTGETQQTLQDELEALTYQRGRLDDAIAASRTQLRLLESLSAGQIDTALGDSRALESVLRLIDETATSAYRKIRDAERESGEIDVQIARKQEALSRFSSRERYTQSLIAAIDVPAARSLRFSASYPVNGASWRWVYQARLDTTRSFLQISRQIAVTQTTGESWDDVELTISSGPTTSRLAPPEHQGQLLSLRSEQESRQFAERAAAAATVEESRREPAPTLVPGGYLRTSVNAVGTAYQTDYRIPGQVSISTGGEPQLFTIDDRGMEVALIATSRPLRDANAYLEARFTLREEFSVQRGAMQFYRDGSFIGSRQISGFLPNEETHLPFGVDSRIKVHVEADEEASGNVGSFRRSTVENTRKRLLITSFHEQPREIDVYAMMPVSQHQDIDVTLDDDATPPTERSVDGSAGQLRWRLTLEPTETETIRHFYSIRYPKGESLRYRSTD